MLTHHAITETCTGETRPLVVLVMAYGVYTIPDIHEDRSIQRSFT